MKIINNKRINETVYFKQLENGLKVYLMPKTTYNKVYATFTTKYGSINTSFKYNGKTYKQPQGIAHYLEHKMFDMPDGQDVFNKLSKLGAQSNAFTSYDQTCYLFSATSNIYECMEILLDFVQTPYFTEESVNKERGIIEQEIKMYDDYPDVISDRGMLSLLFKKTPYKDDIAGKVEDIALIKDSDLYDAYNAFYNPNNMILTVVGNFELDKMINFIKENQNKKSFNSSCVERIIEEEPNEIVKKYGECNIGLAMPKVNYCVKRKPAKNILKEEISCLLYTSLLLGEASDNYNELMSDMLINETFNPSYFVNDKISYINVTSDSTDPKELIERLNKIFTNENVFDERKFELIKKAMLGEFIGMFNSLEYTSRLFTKYILFEENFFDIIDVINNITLDDLYKIDKSIDESLICAYVCY